MEKASPFLCPCRSSAAVQNTNRSGCESRNTSLPPLSRSFSNSKAHLTKHKHQTNSGHAPPYQTGNCSTKLRFCPSLTPRGSTLPNGLSPSPRSSFGAPLLFQYHNHVLSNYEYRYFRSRSNPYLKPSLTLFYEIRNHSPLRYHAAFSPGTFFL